MCIFAHTTGLIEHLIPVQVGDLSKDNIPLVLKNLDLYIFDLSDPGRMSEADLVLVDSRTGVTEHGGVATHHLADMVILLSAANQMNVEGTQWMARELTQPSLKKLRGGRKLQVFPLPSRIEQTAERDIISAFRHEFVDEFRQYATLLSEMDAADFYDTVEIPYMPYYSFKERVVAREEEGSGSVNFTNRTRPSRKRSSIMVSAKAC